MKAKFIAIDFLNYAFMIILAVIVFWYFIQGDRIASARELFTELSKFSFFGIVFLIIFKKNARKVSGLRDREKKTGYFEIIKYLYKKDEIKDWIFLGFLPCLVLLLAYFIDSVNKVDWMQAIAVFYVMTLFHKFFFKKKNVEDRNFLTNSDKMVDEIVVYVLPVMIYGIAIMFKLTNDIDLVQAFAVLAVSYAWHYYYFKPRK